MFDDENEPRHMPKALKNLDPMSVDELQKYIREMEEEIERVRGEIARKKAHMDAAASIFK